MPDQWQNQSQSSEPCESPTPSTIDQDVYGWLLSHSQSMPPIGPGFAQLAEPWEDSEGDHRSTFSTGVPMLTPSSPAASLENGGACEDGGGPGAEAGAAVANAMPAASDMDALAQKDHQTEEQLIRHNLSGMPGAVLNFICSDIPFPYMYSEYQVRIALHRAQRTHEQIRRNRDYLSGLIGATEATLDELELVPTASDPDVSQSFRVSASTPFRFQLAESVRQWKKDLAGVDEALDEATGVVDLVSRKARWCGWDFITPAEGDD